MKAPALAALVACLAAGCASEASRLRAPEPTYAEAANNELVATNYRAADALMAQFGGTPAGGPLIVATIVNIDALELSSMLGRNINR